MGNMENDLIELQHLVRRWLFDKGGIGYHTGVKNDSATNRARAFNCDMVSICTTNRCDIRTKSFISEISLSTSSKNWMINSTNWCFSSCSVWKFVIRNEMSYP